MQITPTQILILLLLLLLCFHFSFINSQSEKFKQTKVDNIKPSVNLGNENATGLIKNIRNLAKKVVNNIKNYKK